MRVERVTVSAGSGSGGAGGPRNNDGGGSEQDDGSYSGPGGNGGNGGAGGGGPTVGVAPGGTSVWSATGTTIATGNPGFGGSTAAGSGAVGLQAAVY